MTVITGKVKNPGIYASVDLNGWTQAADGQPTSHKSVLLGYRVAHLPEVWFGVGFRDGNHYWLGSRGMDPNYQPLKADQVVLWREVEWPFMFDAGRPGTSDYLQYQDILGEQSPAVDAAYTAIALAERLAQQCSFERTDDRSRKHIAGEAEGVIEAVKLAKQALAAVGWIEPAPATA